MRDDTFYLTVVIVIGILCLTVLAVSYWLIMRQDSTVLTTVSAGVGGIVGYMYKYLRDRTKR